MSNVTLIITKASHGHNTPHFTDITLNYTGQILKMFEASCRPEVPLPARPPPGHEEKFCLLLDALFTNYLAMLEGNGDRCCSGKVGEQLVKISGLLVFYGEDVLSGQNPMNDGQSIGSGLLSSIGILLGFCGANFGNIKCHINSKISIQNIE